MLHVNIFVTCRSVLSLFTCRWIRMACTRFNFLTSIREVQVSQTLHWLLFLQSVRRSFMRLFVKLTSVFVRVYPSSVYYRHFVVAFMAFVALMLENMHFSPDALLLTGEPTWPTQEYTPILHMWYWKTLIRGAWPVARGQSGNPGTIKNLRSSKGMSRYSWVSRVTPPLNGLAALPVLLWPCIHTRHAFA